MTEHLVTTIAKQQRCHRCRAPILTALDEGLTARVDATPLRNRDAEIAALLDNRRTYNYTSYGHLYYRDEWRIAASIPPGTAIHAEHKCSTQKGPQQLTLDIGAK